jgi:BirA family biotin operon repressor/biotin-[acetyl-CoA-carboxylase] ligase
VECSLNEASQLSFAASLAIADSVKHYMPEANLSFKWPNDVLLDGKKFCGILLEAEQHQALWLIVGIGINLMEAPKEALYPATALGLDIEPKTFLEHLANNFDRLKKLWHEEGFSKIHALWLSQAHGIGEEIKVRLPQRELHGTFQSLNARGALELATAQGKITIEAGDVFFE